MQVKCCGTCTKCILDEVSSNTGFYCDLDINKKVKLFDKECDEYVEYEESHEFIINDCFDLMY